MAAPDYTTPELVMARLRLSAGDVDALYVETCAATANTLVDHWLDRDELDTDPYPPLTAPFPAPVVYAATGAAVRLYRGKDASSDVAEVWSESGPIRVARNPLEGFVDELAPYRHPRGWAAA